MKLKQCSVSIFLCKSMSLNRKIRKIQITPYFLHIFYIKGTKKLAKALFQNFSYKTSQHFARDTKFENIAPIFLFT